MIAETKADVNLHWVEAVTAYSDSGSHTGRQT